MGLTISGVEITQAIQVFRSTIPYCGTAGARVACEDNALSLIEGRDTVLRVYVSNAVSGQGHMLHALGQAAGTPWMTAEIPPPPTPPDRSITNHTLNLLLPAGAAHGTVSVSITVWDSVPSGGGDTTSVTITFQKTILIPVRLVRINYRGRGLNLPAPSTADFLTDINSFVGRIFPVAPPAVNIVRDSVEVYDGDFSSTLIEGGLVSVEGSTGTVYKILERLMVSEGLASHVLYGAIVPRGSLPTGPATIGVVFPSGSFGRRFFAVAGAAESLADEIGAILWSVVAPCVALTQTDRVYDPPLLGPSFPSGSIGEVGMDVSSRRALAPSGYTDLLSGFEGNGGIWISPYTYQGLVRRLTCTQRPPRVPGASRPSVPLPDRPMIDVTLVRDQLGQYTIVDLPSWAVPSPVPPLNDTGPQFLELRADDGQVLFRQGVDGWQLSDSEAGRSRVRVSLPWADEGASLALVEGDRTLLTHSIETSAPGLDVDFDPSDTMRNGPMVLRWRVLEAEARERVGVLFRASADGGITWVGVSGSLASGRVRISPSQLPVGDACVLEVLASCGLRTTRWTSRPFRVPARTPQTPSILRPASGARVRPGAVLELFGVPAVGRYNLDELIWSSNVDGKLGTGTRLTVNTLSVGEHIIELRADAFPDRVDRVNLVVGLSRRRPYNEKPQHHRR